MIWTGCHINFEKNTLLPRRDRIFLGIGHDTVNMRFFLGRRRCKKMRKALKELFVSVKIGLRVKAKYVTRVVGILWSIEVVCHRVVTIMCKSMIATLVKMLRDPHLIEKNQFNLRRLLK